MAIAELTVLPADPILGIGTEPSAATVEHLPVIETGKKGERKRQTGGKRDKESQSATRHFHRTRLKQPTSSTKSRNRQTRPRRRHNITQPRKRNSTLGIPEYLDGDVPTRRSGTVGESEYGEAERTEGDALVCLVGGGTDDGAVAAGSVVFCDGGLGGKCVGEGRDLVRSRVGVVESG